MASDFRRTLWWRLVASVISVLTVGCATTAPVVAPDMDLPPHEVHRFDNGLTLITVENHARPIIGLTAYVTTGGRTEDAHYAGALHFIEHLVFKGGTKRFAPTEFRKRIATLGDENGGWTWDDEIQFGFEMPVDAFDEALDIFAESLLELKFSSAWFESERKVVLQEIEKVSERPWHRVWNAFDEQMFVRHPYRRAVIGSADTVKGQTMAELEAYYRQRFTPNHLQLTIVGDFDTAALVEAVRKRFGRYQPGPASFELPPREVAEPTVAEMTPKRHEFHYGTDSVARVLAGFRTPGAAHPDNAALLVLAELLDSASDGVGASLYRQDQWVSSVGVGHSFMVDYGQFSVRAEVPVEKTGAVTAWLEGFLTSLDSASFDADAVRDAARRVLVQRARRWERYGEQAQGFGFMVERMGHEAAAALTARILAQTPESLAAVARRYFRPNAYVEVLQLPEGAQRSAPKPIETADGASRPPERALAKVVDSGQAPADGWSIATQDSADGVTWYRFKNGFELIVSPSSASPTLTAVAHTAGGQWVETPEQAGLSELTARSLTSGSTHLTVTQWDRTLEAKGLLGTSYVSLGDRSNVSRNVFSRDGSTFAMSGTAAQMPLVVGLIGEALFRPVFPDEEVAKARRSLLTEIETLENDNLEYIKQVFYEHAYPGHPYGRPTIGTRASMGALGAADVRAHHARTYAPDRITLAVVGPVVPDDVVQAVRRSMGAVEKAPLGPLPPVPDLNPPASPQRVLSLGRAQRCINFGRPTLRASHESFETLEVLMTIARGHHFYKYVYDRGVSYRSWVRLWPHRGGSAWILENDIAREGFEDSLAEIRRDLDRFSRNFAGDADVEVARRRLLNRDLLDGQRTMYTAFGLARSNVLGRGWQGPARRRAALARVTTKKVLSMARRVFGTRPTYEVILK